MLTTHDTSPSDAKWVHPRPSSSSFDGAIFPADYAIKHNLTPFISMQNQYSLVYREEEREMFPTLKVNIFSQCLWRVENDLLLTLASSRCLAWGLSHGRL